MKTKHIWDPLFKPHTLPGEFSPLEHLANLRSPHGFHQRMNVRSIGMDFDPFCAGLEEWFITRQSRLVEDIVV
jgi:hypothetical protein